MKSEATKNLRNALYFNRAELDRQIERSDIAYHALINRFLTMARREIAGRASDAVCNEIARQMEPGICTLENVARTLGSPAACSGASTRRASPSVILLTTGDALGHCRW